MNLQKEELDDARKGTLFFLGKLEASRRPSFDLGLVSNFAGSTSILTDLKHGSELLLNQYDVGKKVISGYQTYLQPITELFQSFFDKITECIAKTYGEASAALEWVGEFSAWGISTLAGSLADLIPGWGYIQNAIDLYDGVKKAVINCIKWLSQIYSGWGVKLLEGGPSSIANAIAANSAAGLAGGLKDIAIASVKTGLQAAGDSAGGAGAIVGAVTGVLQRIANMINYAVQRFLIARTFNQAAKQWRMDGDMLRNHNQFNQWFKRSVVCTPIIAALTLNSGYVGNPLRFLALINPDGEIVTQAEYDQGVKHIETLKSLSKDYIKEYADHYKLEFKAPNSDTVNNTLKALQS